MKSLRVMTCTAALAGSASLGAVAVPQPIGAASPPLTVTCTSLSGSATTATISKCTGTGAIAADAGTPPAHGVFNVVAKTISWSNGKTTKASYTYKPSSDTSCPTVAKYTKELLETASGTVTGGTAKGMVKGSLKAKVCIYDLTAAPHTVISRNEGNVTI